MATLDLDDKIPEQSGNPLKYLRVNADATNMEWVALSGAGESNTSSNVGTGQGLAKAKEVVDLPFKSLIGQTNKIILVGNPDDVTITLGSDVVITTDVRLSDARTPLAHTHAISDVTNLQTSLDGKESSLPTKVGNSLKLLRVNAGETAVEWAVGGAGEANTQTNQGIGEGTLAKTKVGVDLPIKSLKQGANITLTNNVDDVTIAVSGLTKSSVGLGSVDNTSDIGKPVSTAQQTALDLKQNSLGYTAENVINKGAISGYASLTASQKHLSTEIPFGTLINTVTQGNDSRLSDSRTPLAHATSHKTGGSDSIKLDEFTAPNDNTTLDATTLLHGLFPKADKSKLDGIASGANLYVHPNHSGDVTSTGDGATVIGAGKVTDAMMSITEDVMLSGLEFIIDGGGSAITTGIKGDLEIPFNCTIEQVTLLADQTGSIVIDIWKDTYANFPPTVADTITAAAIPTITTATKSQDATLTGWNKTIVKGDILRFNVNSITTIQRVTLSLRVRK